MKCLNHDVKSDAICILEKRKHGFRGPPLSLLASQQLRAEAGTLTPNSVPVSFQVGLSPILGDLLMVHLCPEISNNLERLCALCLLLKDMHKALPFVLLLVALREAKLLSCVAVPP